MKLKRKVAALIILVSLTGTPVNSLTLASAVQEKARTKPVRGQIKKMPLSALRAPLFWQEQGDIEALDLYYGPGGREGAPDPAGKFKFIRRITKGASTKYVVEDGRRRKWMVKLGVEAKPETAATRILWAMGYPADETYFVKRARIVGKKSFVVRDVRFERFREGYKEVGNWSWQRNPFVGTRELAGLKVLMALLNNWDLKKSNNSIFCPERGGARCIYLVSDLGATFGKTGSPWRTIFFFADPPAGSKGKPRDYARQRFIDETERGEVDFNYKGKDPSALKGVSVESAQWMGDRLARLSDKQLADAFRASGFNQQEVSLYTEAFRRRVRQLRSLE
jgi:hypothetical protein